MTYGHKFSNELATKIFAMGVEDERSYAADRTETFLEMYRKFYTAARSIEAAKLRPARKKAEAEQIESMRNLHAAANAIASKNYGLAQYFLNVQIGIK